MHLRKEEKVVLANPPHTLSQQVKESRRLGDCCKIVLFFDKNPYFYNEQIVKEYVVGVTSKWQLSGWVAGGRVVPLRCGPAPSDTLLLLQDTGRMTLPQFGGRSIMSVRPTGSGTRTVALTSSTGCQSTALPGLAGLQRWVKNSTRTPPSYIAHCMPLVDSPAAWHWDLSPVRFCWLTGHQRGPVAQSPAVLPEKQGYEERSDGRSGEEPRELGAGLQGASCLSGTAVPQADKLRPEEILL